MRYFVYLLIMLPVFFPSALHAQDVLYKSNGETITVKVLQKSRYELSYIRNGDVQRTVYHLLTAALDSAHYQDGTKEVYTVDKIPLKGKMLTNPVYGPHLIGLDIGAIVFYNRSLSFSYEYQLAKRRLGIKAMFGVDLKESEFWDSEVSAGTTRKGHFTRVGLNWYIFPPGAFRISTGLHFIASNYRIVGQRTIYEENPPYESHHEYIDTEKKYRYGVLNVSVYYQIVNHLILSAGIDFPARAPGDPGAIFRSEILLNF